MPQVEFVVFEPADCRMAGWFSGLPNIQTRPTPIPSEGRWRKLFFSSRFWGKELRQDTFDIFEGFHLPLPKVPSGKTILTGHEGRRLHRDWGWLSRTAFRFALSRAISSADMVVTVSEAMKHELLPYCGQTPVCVIPNGLETASTFFQPKPDELEAFSCKFALPDRFLLAVGHLERRKNYPKLIEALAHLHSLGRACHLFIVGNESGEREALEAMIAANGLKGSVTLASGLSDMEVRCAYTLCELFVFPSTYEGFGIPILEAMAAGKPMVLSDIPVFREITESRSVYFAPDDPKDLALAIERVLTSRTTMEEGIAYGFQRLSAYDYPLIADLYVNLYSQLICI
jgi:glycosyltransferase involved in cell wall biosynthesis